MVVCCSDCWSDGFCQCGIYFPAPPSLLIFLCPGFGRYHKSQAIYLESKDNQKLSCVISSVGANEVGIRSLPREQTALRGVESTTDLTKSSTWKCSGVLSPVGWVGTVGGETVSSTLEPLCLPEPGPAAPYEPWCTSMQLWVWEPLNMREQMASEHSGAL